MSLKFWPRLAAVTPPTLSWYEVAMLTQCCRDNPGQLGTSALILPPPPLSLLLRFHRQSWSGLWLSAGIASRFGETCDGVLVVSNPFTVYESDVCHRGLERRAGGLANSAWRPSVWESAALCTKVSSLTSVSGTTCEQSRLSMLERLSH